MSLWPYSQDSVDRCACWWRASGGTPSFYRMTADEQRQTMRVFERKERAERAELHVEVAKAKWAHEHDAYHPLLEEALSEASIAAAESGADREADYNAERWTEEWLAKWFRDKGEPSFIITNRMLRTVYDNTESFDIDCIGSELAYLSMAMVDDLSDSPNKQVMWDLRDAASRYLPIHKLFTELFQPYDPVWDYITIIE